MAYADHLTIAELVDEVLDRRTTGARKEPAILGICGAQGSGKSTMTATLDQHFRDRGQRVAQLSLDDLYLRRVEREQLAERVHPLLITRGVPGTHDVKLGEEVLDALARPGRIRLPRFDKSIDDRFPENQWDEVEGPVDLILFEGWCIGARAQPEADLDHPVNILEREEDRDGRWRHHANAALNGEYQRLFVRIDLLMLLAAPSFEIVARWRTEQEDALREKLTAEGKSLGSGLMNATQIDRFVQHYERITRHILAEMPSRADLVVELDENRRIVRSAQAR